MSRAARSLQAKAASTNKSAREARELTTLPNGARLVFDPMPNLRSAAVGVAIGAGARHEPEHLCGLAHFLEHMAFKGAGNRNAREIAEAVEAVGGSLNAATEYERTSYHVRCLAEDAPDMLDIVLALVFDPAHPANEMAREKGVVAQEIGEAADQPDDLVATLAQAAAFPDHPLGRPILGTEASLAAIEREDLFRFARTAYAPERVVVTVAGAADQNAIRDRVEHWLGAWPATPLAKCGPPKKALPGPHAVTRKLEQCHFIFSREGGTATSADRFACRLFVEILGGGMASRLFQEVREARGLAYSIDAANEDYSDAGRITVYAGSAPGDVNEIGRLTQGIWEDLATRGPSPQELARAKAVMRAGHAMALESPGARAGSAAYELLMFDRLLDFEEIMSRIDAVTQSEVCLAARRSLESPLVGAIVGPAKGVRQFECLFA